MKKINKLFTVLLFAALSVISCKNNFSELLNEAEYTNEKAYLSFGINESEERMVAPNPITWDDVSSIELKKDGSALKSWTSYVQMKADTSIVLDAGTYTFEILLKDAAGDILQTGKLENVEIKAGNNSLNFMTKACLEGKGRLSVNCYVDNPISVEKVSVKLDDVVVEALSLNDDRGQIYSPVILGTAEVDCGNYLITIFINEEKVITDFIEIQNKRETVYNYHYDEKTNVYPVKFLLDDGNNTLVEFGEGVTIDTYITGGELPDPATITNIPEGLEFWDWAYQNGEKKIKITKLPENTDGQVVVYARYGKSVTNATDLKNSLDNGVKSFKITPEEQNYWNILLDEIKGENNITVILDLTNISFEYNKISSGYFNGENREFKPTVTEIVIPASVTEIEGSAFQGCTQLESVTFAEGSELSSIGTYAFDYCPSLEEIVIPASVTSIGKKGFSGCRSLKKITFAEGSELSSIGIYAFYNCTSLEEIVIPASVGTIGEYAFYDCENLKKVTFENDSQLNEIQDYAFQGCTSLEEISIPASVTSLVKSFYDCEKLKKVTFEGNSITKIPSQTFGNCDSLEEITIPSSVKTIGYRAFVYSDNLRNVIFTSDSQLEEIDTTAFEGCPNVRLIISSDLATNSSFATMLKSDAYKFKLIVNEDLDESAFDANKGLYEVEILANVTKIGNAAFYECENLEKVTFEEGSRLTTIGLGAFHTCKITEIVIPASVTWIKDYAFAYCSNLSKVTYLGDKSKIRFGTDAFNGTKVQEN